MKVAIIACIILAVSAQQLVNPMENCAATLQKGVGVAVELRSALQSKDAMKILGFAMSKSAYIQEFKNACLQVSFRDAKKYVKASLTEKQVNCLRGVHQIVSAGANAIRLAEAKQFPEFLNSLSAISAKASVSVGSCVRAFTPVRRLF